MSMRAKTRGAVDLELWDVAREAPLFRSVFGTRIQVERAKR